MKINLTLKERIILFSVLTNNRKASVADWRVLNEAKLVIGLGDKDFKKYGITQDGDTIKWEQKEKADKEEEYEIPNRAYEIMVTDLRNMDKKGEFPSSDFALAAAKFIED